MPRTTFHCHWISFFVAFAAGFLALPLSGQDTTRIRYLPCSFTDGSDSPYFRTRALAFRLLREAKQLFPSQSGAMETLLEIARPGQEAEFSVETRRARKTLVIRLPADDDIPLERNMPLLRAMAARIVLARMGISPDRAPELLNHWVIRALIRSTIRNAEQSHLPIAKEFPAAYAFASHGICPSVRATTRLNAWDQGATAALNDEYAELLLYAVLRNSRKGEERILLILRDALSPALESPPLESTLGFASEEECDAWFRRSVESTLLNSFSPAAPELLEKRYSVARVWTGKNADEQETTLTIPDFARTAEEDQDAAPPREAIQSVLERLNELTRIASPPLVGPLTTLRSLVARCREGSSNAPTRDELQNAELHVFDALNADQALRGRLGICEIRTLPPGVRFPYSLKELDWDKERNSPESEALRALLDRWDEFR